MKYIIADDLSGANDTGVQFTKKGYHSVVSIMDNQSTLLIPEKIDVFVIDTETRELEDRPARGKIQSLLKKLQINQDDFLYKKVDSTMRGNIGVEIEEIMRFLQKDICIFSPSFPLHHRVTIDSFLIVDQKLRGKGEYLSHQFNQDKYSFIPAILKKQTVLSIGQIFLKDIVRGPKAILAKINELYEKGNQIIVLDSTTEKHLEDIFNCGLKFQRSVLFSGSAGLAEHFPIKKDLPKKLLRHSEDFQSPVIIVAGSRNPIVGQQIRYLKKYLHLPDIRIDLEEFFADRERIFENYIARSVEFIKTGQDLLIYTDAVYNDKNSINDKLMTKYHLSFRELEIEIKKIFGKLTAEIIKQTNTRNLILTGGDVALGVCEELKIDYMNILDELLPGIPLTSAHYENHTLYIITKAGGFGKEDTLYFLIKELKND